MAAAEVTIAQESWRLCSGAAKSHSATPSSTRCRLADQSLSAACSRDVATRDAPICPPVGRCHRRVIGRALCSARRTRAVVPARSRQAAPAEVSPLSPSSVSRW